LGFIPLPSAPYEGPADDTYFTEIVDEADLLSSLAISIREAAYRRDPATIALHVAELRGWLGAGQGLSRYLPATYLRMIQTRSRMPLR
jgi:hypothetical protein